jgi:cyclohexyl-isocyanide hydratase
VPSEIGLLLMPGLTQLDLTGPYEVFARVPDARVHLIWKTLEAVRADSGLGLLPTVTLAACPPLEVVCVPGGPGVDGLLEDGDVLDWLRRQAAGARYVVSVCTGSLVLGAAGLLRGRAAACHWASRPLLSHFGAEPTDARVVHDGSVFTGGGVTAGIDVALEVVAALRGRAVAEAIQLMIEYDPQPPFAAGSPSSAPAEVVERVRLAMAPRLQEREVRVRRAAEALQRQRVAH